MDKIAELHSRPEDEVHLSGFAATEGKFQLIYSLSCHGIQFPSQPL